MSGLPYLLQAGTSSDHLTLLSGYHLGFSFGYVSPKALVELAEGYCQVVGRN
jgi:hypothetical protein